MNINTNEIREKLKYVKNGELEPTIEAVQALKAVVLAVPELLDELDGLRDTARKDTSQGCAIDMVLAERKRQDEKWGDQSGNHPFEWMSILGEEYGELCEAVNETCFANAQKKDRGGRLRMLKEAIQVAAVAVAYAEALLRIQGADRKCRVCGCDHFHPCPGGCYWVEEDLCSACAEATHASGKCD